MQNGTIGPMRISGLVAPVMRPLPTIITYARLTAERPRATPQAVDEEYQGSLAALLAVVEEAARGAGAPPDDYFPILDRLVAVTDLRGESLAVALDGCLAALGALHRRHDRSLRRTVAARQDRFRDLYREHAVVKKVLVYFGSAEIEKAESFERKLVERCYYDYASVTDDWDRARPYAADVVLFAPSRRPLPVHHLEKLERLGIPFLILAGGEGAREDLRMADLKAEHHYRSRGYQVLRSPFMPVRLYQAIDALSLRHLAAKVVVAPRPRAAIAAEIAQKGVCEA